MKRLFHYTTMNALSSILKDGEIKPSTAFIEKIESPAVWCSFNPIWEETANKGYFQPSKNLVIPLTKEQTHELSGGLIRFEVSPESAPHNWSGFRKKSGISRNAFRSLEKINRYLGINAQRNWRISFCPIHEDSWKSIEFWDGKEWKPCIDEDEKEVKRYE